MEMKRDVHVITIDGGLGDSRVRDLFVSSQITNDVMQNKNRSVGVEHEDQNKSIHFKSKTNCLNTKYPKLNEKCTFKKLNQLI